MKKKDERLRLLAVLMRKIKRAVKEDMMNRELKIESRLGEKTFIDVDCEKFLKELKKAIEAPHSKRIRTQATLNVCIQVALSVATKEKVYIQIYPRS